MRDIGKTIKAFMQCLSWAEEGKTFIYVHPKFVAVDTKTWENLQNRTNLEVIMDEISDTPLDDLKEVVVPETVFG